MAFGLPYIGSKSAYATKILDALPAGERLVDLFAGGCSVTDCALRQYSDKWRRVLACDINGAPLELYKRALQGGPFNYNWVTREEFHASEDYETRLIW